MQKANKQQPPIISIIMPVYNQERYVREAINSIVKQGYKNWELIIVDDGSTDATPKYIRHFSDRRIVYLRNSKNRGIARSLNRALTIAKGELIARMDADDISLPNRLQTQLHYLKQHPDIGLVGSWAELIDANDKVLGIKQFPTSDWELKRSLHFMNPFIHPSVMFRRHLIANTGSYDPYFEGAEDYDLWLRFAKITKLTTIPQILIKYRLQANNVSFSSTNRLRWAYARVQLRKITKYGYPFWEAVFSIKALIAMLLPQQLSKFIYQHFYSYQKSKQLRIRNKIAILFIKPFVILLKKSADLSALSIRLVKWTGKHPQSIHPKHLLNTTKAWYLNYLRSCDVVLDLGCNNGQHTLKAALLCKYIEGVDIDKQMLTMARNEAKRQKIKNVVFKVADLERKLIYPNGYFNKIIYLDVLEHIYNRDQSLQEVKRILKKNGELFLAIPNRDTKWKRLQKKMGMFYYTDYDHKYEYTRTEILDILKNHGFQIITITPITLDTPFVGFIDLLGGISLKMYQKVWQWRKNVAYKFPNESIGFQIICKKI